MKKKARVIDVYSYGCYHEVINQGFLMMISLLYDEVVYVAEKTSIENLKKLLDSCGVDYSNVSFVEKKIWFPKFKSAGLSYLFRIVKVSLYNWLYYLRTPRNTDVFYNNNLYFAIWLLKNLSFAKGNRVFDLCHNEMEIIDPSKRDSRVISILGSFFDLVFKKNNLPAFVEFILLSPKMVEYFNSWIKEENRSHIQWIDHCYIRPENKKVKDVVVYEEKIKIGVPGAINEKRGLPQLKQILSKMKRNNVKIYATSFVLGINNMDCFECLNKTGKLLPFDIYNSYIQQMDALMLFYNCDSYKLTASGAILEAIWNEKAIYALRNEYFDYLFDEFGELGELFDTVEELTNRLNSLSKEEIGSFKKNLQDAKKKLHPEQVAYRLRAIINA